MTERWKSVVGYEGFYEVSTRGRVKSLARPGVRNIRILSPCKTSPCNNFMVHLSRHGQKKKLFVARLVLEAFHGPRPAGMEIRHLRLLASFQDRLSNLRYGTHAQNIRDRDRHGTTARGASHGMFKHGRRMKK